VPRGKRGHWLVPSLSQLPFRNRDCLRKAVNRRSKKSYSAALPAAFSSSIVHANRRPLKKCEVFRSSSPVASSPILTFVSLTATPTKSSPGPKDRVRRARIAASAVPDERFVSGALTHYCKMSWITARRAVLSVSPWSFARSGIIKGRSARDPTLWEIVGENTPSCSLRQGAAA
jgi:hypothetical protein